MSNTGISYYECHITLMAEHTDLIKNVVETLKWKFSVIDGDPVLGKGIKCYATRLFNRRNAQDAVQQELFNVAATLSELGFAVLRRKIELVIFDDRSSRVQCNGGCVECHLDDL